MFMIDIENCGENTESYSIIWGFIDIVIYNKKTQRSY